MKKFVVNCDFGGQIAPFAVYVGIPEGGHHPLHFQADWLSKNRGGSIPPNIMDAIGRLKDLAAKNKVSLEELCVYALGSAQQEKDADKAGSEGGGEVGEFDDLLDEDYDDDDYLVMTEDADALDNSEELLDAEENLDNPFPDEDLVEEEILDEAAEKPDKI